MSTFLAAQPTLGRRIEPSTPPSWHQSMKQAVRDPLELCRELRLPATYHDQSVAASKLFPVFAPREFIRRMTPGEANDPLLRQVLPLGVELQQVDGFVDDPVGDLPATLAPGMIQKYDGRALLISTGVCAVHCRYCFRRRFPYGEAPVSIRQWEPALQQLEALKSVNEVILSGGDPLTLVDRQLEALVARLARIPHLRRLRIHTRLPIVIPQRVTDQMLSWLTFSRLRPIVVLHTNHPNEIDSAVESSLGRLVEAGALVMNQAVLLKGVNDDAGVLADLCLQLTDLRVLPYYLHQLDRVTGAAHFEVPIAKGKRIVDQLRRRLPGYAMPRYVQEVAGEESKCRID